MNNVSGGRRASRAAAAGNTHNMSSRRKQIAAASLAGILLLCAPAVAAAAPTATAAPKIYVSPDPVRPGGKVIVRGTGFCHKISCGRVAVSFASRRIGSIRPDKHGRFTIAFGALAGPGSYPLLAKQRTRTARSTLHVSIGGP